MRTAKEKSSVQFNVRLQPTTVQLVNQLKVALGVSQADVVRLAVRRMARQELRKADNA